MNDLKLSVIVPCFNEDEVLIDSYDQITDVLGENNFKHYELLFINDGSTDRTLEILQTIARDDQHVKVISFSRNFGHQPAVSAGIHHCTGDLAVIIDADLQDPPALIPEMVKKYQAEKCNVVYGVRRKRKGESIFKRMTASLYYRFLNSLSDVALPLDTGDFRLIDKKVIDQFKKLSEKNKYIRGLVSWIGFKQVPIYYERAERHKGETKYPLSRMIRFATTGLLYFSKKPLKLAIAMGFVSIIIGFLLAFYVFYSKFSNQIQTVPGWASTLIVIIFFGGIQLLTVGVIGEYIGSIFDEVKGRPEYIIDEIIQSDED